MYATDRWVDASRAPLRGLEYWVRPAEPLRFPPLESGTVPGFGDAAAHSLMIRALSAPRDGERVFFTYAKPPVGQVLIP